MVDANLPLISKQGTPSRMNEESIHHYHCLILGCQWLGGQARIHIPQSFRHRLLNRGHKNGDWDNHVCTIQFFGPLLLHTNISPSLLFPLSLVLLCLPHDCCALINPTCMLQEATITTSVVEVPQNVQWAESRPSLQSKLNAILMQGMTSSSMSSSIH